MITAVEVLRLARVLLSDELRWCKGEAALDLFGNRTTARSPAACQWCLRAALDRSCPNDVDPRDMRVCRKVFAAVQRSIPGSQRATNPAFSIHRFNDHENTTHADVLAVCDAAIAAETIE